MSTLDTTKRADRIEQSLREKFQPTEIAIVDESALHAGHSGAREGGETHYRVRLVSARFDGMSRVDRSRIVHAELKAEFDTGLHAIALELRSPTEMQQAR